MVRELATTAVLRVVGMAAVVAVLTAAVPAPALARDSSQGVSGTPALGTPTADSESQDTELPPSTADVSTAPTNPMR